MNGDQELDQQERDARIHELEAKLARAQLDANEARSKLEEHRAKEPSEVAAIVLRLAEREREMERSAVVALLRSNALRTAAVLEPRIANMWNAAADYIERGEHRK